MKEILVQEKIKGFLKKYFINPGDCCPEYAIEKFIASDLNDEHNIAEQILNSILEHGYCKRKVKGIGNVFEVTNLGIKEFFYN